MCLHRFMPKEMIKELAPDKCECGEVSDKLGELLFPNDKCLFCKLKELEKKR